MIDIDRGIALISNVGFREGIKEAVAIVEKEAGYFDDAGKAAAKRIVTKLREELND